MKLVSKNYVEMTKFDIFHQMVKAGDSEENYDEVKVNYFQNMLRVVMDHENATRHKTHVDYFYVPVDNIDLSNIGISRKLLLNALIYASVNSEYDMIKKIKPYLFLDKVDFSFDNDVINYALENGLPFEEYIDGEKERLIFNKDLNCLEYGYVYNHTVKLERRKK